MGAATGDLVEGVVDRHDRPSLIRCLWAGVVAILLSIAVPIAALLAAVSIVDLAVGGPSPFGNTGGIDAAGGVAGVIAILICGPVAIVWIRKALFERLARASVGWGVTILSTALLSVDYVARDRLLWLPVWSIVAGPLLLWWQAERDDTAASGGAGVVRAICVISLCAAIVAVTLPLTPARYSLDSWDNSIRFDQTRSAPLTPYRPQMLHARRALGASPQVGTLRVQAGTANYLQFAISSVTLDVDGPLIRPLTTRVANGAIDASGNGVTIVSRIESLGCTSATAGVTTISGVTLHYQLAELLHSTTVAFAHPYRFVCNP